MTGIFLIGLLFALPQQEELRFNVNWPSGLTLGESQLRATRSGDRWQFEFSIDASIPGFVVSDQIRSLTSSEFCSIEAEKNTTHGKRVSKEKTTFAPQSGMATRQTVGGGKSEFAISGCAKDALAFLFHAREELARGRVPASEKIYLGAPYDIRMQFGGVQQLRLSSEVVEAEKLTVFVKGATSETSFEMFFARDAARTPLLVKLPLAMGMFSMEIAR